MPYHPRGNSAANGEQQETDCHAALAWSLLQPGTNGHDESNRGNCRQQRPRRLPGRFAGKQHDRCPSEEEYRRPNQCSRLKLHVLVAVSDNVGTSYTCLRTENADSSLG